MLMLLIYFTQTMRISVMGQTTCSLLNTIKTVQVKVDGEWGTPPVMTLGGGHFVEISFDDLQHNYVRYTYVVKHCDANWKESDIYEGDYLDGINGMDRLEDYTLSMNTEMEYNHYSFCLPNKNINLKLSGNYKVNIMEDGDEEPVAEVFFSVLEPRVGIDIDISANTDIDTYDTHQQLSFSVNFPNYYISNPTTEIRPVILQNHRWDTRVTDIMPTSVKMNEMTYKHNQQLIFNAGNEYRRFEILNKYVPTMHVDSMRFQKPYYHAYLSTDKVRINYLYDQDQDGRFYVRNNDNIDNDSESDYFMTHFTLNTPPVPGGDVYLNGDLAENSYFSMYKMDYNQIDHQYELVLPLKQGSYNYQYVVVNNEVGNPGIIEGNFHQTENEYDIYIYHREPGARYDKLVGFQHMTYEAQ